jgi:DNA-directed RNA polymerase specialized sigma24 family protein
LVLGTRRGDQEAAQALFERYRDAAYRIAYHHVGRAEDALDRRQGRLGLRAAGTDEETGDARPQAIEHTTPAQEAETRELARGIHEAISGLQEHHREVLLLISQGGLSYREVAEELGIPIGTVMSRLHYARRAVRDWLSERGYL